jgi:hypothetical protein
MVISNGSSASEPCAMFTDIRRADAWSALSMNSAIA